MSTSLINLSKVLDPCILACHEKIEEPKGRTPENN
jgi:hypothetical protein